MLHWKFQANVFGLCFIQGLLCKSIYLTPTEAYVDVNKSLSFACTYIGYGDVIGTRWNIDYTHTPSIIRSPDGACSGNGIFANDVIYRVGCPSETSFTVTILRVQLEDHNVLWKCFDRERTSNSVTLFVKVPVINVILTLSDASSRLLKEHSRQTIKCRTSNSRPKPNIEWYLQESSRSGKHEIDVNSSTRIISSIGDGRVAVESTLLFYPNRSINGWSLHCEGWTDNENRTVQSNNFKLNITYPPNNPPTIFGLDVGKMYRLIESEIGKLSCSVYGGNPLPRLAWNCYNNTQTSDTIDGQTVINNVTWIGFRAQTSCSCISFHSWSGITQSTIVSIDVLYPPRIPTITISNGTRYIKLTTSSVQLTEMDNINMTCYSEANPTPSYTWTSHNTKIQHNVCYFVSLSRTDAGSYNCNVNNMMSRTFGETKIGSNFSSISLDILYPSTIRSLKDKSILEGSNLTIMCHVQYGNPTQEKISWTRSSDSKIWKSNRLIITNVSRADDTIYICTLTSRIIPTIGNEIVKVNNRSLHLNVFFPTEIKYFSLRRSQSKGKYIVNNMDEVLIDCAAEANPASDLSINHPSGTNIATVKNRNSLNYKIANASFENAGIYTCEGRNNYTIYRPPISRLILIVKSPPRLSPDSKFANKIAAALHTNGTLQFVAQDYLDEQNKTDFIWFKQNNTVTRRDTRFDISSNGLYSNLSVRNITKTDYGEYSVKVFNSVGEYIHFYELIAEDKPDMPVSFTYTPESVTTSSVTLTWTPGFNGGFPQVQGRAYFMHSSSTYEDLDSSKKEENVYNQVFVSDTSEQNDSKVQQLSSFTGTDSSSDKVNETSVYVNMTF